jgi:flavin reductase (DIM6/NTAB) family NADH-FMN oxidoreductase RutF
MFVQEFDPNYDDLSGRLPHTCASDFRTSMRATAASVVLLTSRHADGRYFGMAATSWASLSMDPPSMLVAVNRSASVHAVIAARRHFCLNLMSENHSAILDRFSRSDMRDERFLPGDWDEGPQKLPVLRGALASQICTVQGTFDYGTHTIFVGRVDEVLLLTTPGKNPSPLVWMNGSQASLSVKVHA